MVECFSSCAGMTTTSQGAFGSRPNHSPIASFARASDARATSSISSRVAEVEVLVLAQGLQGVVQVLGAEQASTELDELAVDPPNLLETDGVDLLGVDLERCVRARELGVRLRAAGKVRQPG